VPLLATGALLAATGIAQPAQPPDLPALLAEARRVQQLDLEAWQGFAFHRQVLRQRLDRRGQVTFRQQLEFEVEPVAGGGFDELLVAIDCRAPTAAEVREHRREARFSRHYQRAREGRFGGVLGVGELDFGYLFGALDYDYGGRRTEGGVDYHRLVIVPPEGEPGRGDDPLTAATAGELGLTVDGHHLVRAATRLTRPVSQGLVEVERLEIDFEARRAAGGVWLPGRIEVRSSVRGLVHLRAHNVYTYSGFERRGPGASPPGR
jgi:hypothetical protein